MNEARAACSADTNCASIYDEECDGLGEFDLCRINVLPRDSSGGSCLYVKQSISGKRSVDYMQAFALPS